MTAEEAVDVIENGRHEETVIEKALTLAVIALKMRTPKKAARVENDKTDGCPICGRAFYEAFKYCPNCGQAIDWEE